MNLLGVVAGAALMAAGVAGFSVSARVNGSPFGGLRGGIGTRGGDTGLEGGETAVLEEFRYEGRVDHSAGIRRRLIAAFWLILLTLVLGGAVAGGIFLLVSLVVRIIIRYAKSG